VTSNEPRSDPAVAGCQEKDIQAVKAFLRCVQLLKDSSALRLGLSHAPGLGADRPTSCSSSVMAFARQARSAVAMGESSSGVIATSRKVDLVWRAPG
jgi:hypothetical protein